MHASFHHSVVRSATAGRSRLGYWGALIVSLPLLRISSFVGILFPGPKKSIETNLFTLPTLSSFAFDLRCLEQDKNMYNTMSQSHFSCTMIQLSQVKKWIPTVSGSRLFIGISSANLKSFDVKYFYCVCGLCVCVCLCDGLKRGCLKHQEEKHHVLLSFLPPFAGTVGYPLQGWRRAGGSMLSRE